MKTQDTGGPLAGLKVIEMVGLGPGPFAGMLLADMGAEVVAVDRPGGVSITLSHDINRRGKRSVELDLKSRAGKAAVLDLVSGADVLIEGNRPGVMERLGLGPEDCWKINPRLVYGRMTGWGQDGPLAQAAGHDLNYIALAGALHPMGPPDGPPPVPLNLVGDYGGGAMFLAFGVMAAVYEAQKSGKGQVVDAAMVDGASLLMSFFHSLRASGWWVDRRGDNFLDGAAHFYGCYACADGKFVSVGAIELPFMRVLVERAGLPREWLDLHMDRAEWPRLKAELAALFATRPQAEWCDLLEGSDACFAPVLPFWEAAEHPHAKARGAFITRDGVVEPAPAPRFSRSRPPLAESGDA
ncbi:CaiB/BaiF CoA transferase family protein [Nioella nitratireducens]|uniref:CaiB/BaiF CoA transferase family protein n=1 Tax=Nioella nitratireducens TaxID=1287720 RepID=UPI0008FD74ED|nr:CaiB/BaiF CoA-transferase family protein [Nioella nitratireducens]